MPKATLSELDSVTVWAIIPTLRLVQTLANKRILGDFNFTIDQYKILTAIS